MADEYDLADREEQIEAQAHEEHEVQEQETVEDVQERNWKALRETADAIKRERDQYKQGYETLAQVLQTLNPQQQQAKSEPEEEDPQAIIDRVVSEIGDEDDYPSPTAFKKAIKEGLKNAIDISEKRAVKIAKKVYEDMNRGPSTAQKYSDFNKVVTTENFDRFIKNNKVIYSLIERSDNPFEAAYEYIKNHREYQDESAAPLQPKQVTPQQSEVKEKLKKNASAPKLGSAPTRVIAESVSQFRTMTPEQKLALVQETERYARRI